MLNSIHAFHSPGTIWQFLPYTQCISWLWNSGKILQLLPEVMFENIRNCYLQIKKISVCLSFQKSIPTVGKKSFKLLSGPEKNENRKQWEQESVGLLAKIYPLAFHSQIDGVPLHFTVCMWWWQSDDLGEIKWIFFTYFPFAYWLIKLFCWNKSEERQIKCWARKMGIG